MEMLNEGRPSLLFQRSMINKLYIFAFSGLCCSKLFPALAPSLWPSTVVLVGLGSAAALFPAAFISAPGSAFHSIIAAAGNVYCGDQDSMSVWIFWVKFMRLFTSCFLLICGEGARTEGTWVSFLLGIERHVKIFWLRIFRIFSLWF